MKLSLIESSHDILDVTDIAQPSELCADVPEDFP
jgi:hypothetical protein